MLPSDHPLAPLQSEAALGSPWPTLHYPGSTEDEILEALEALVAVLGPVPQADQIQPWDPTDPEEPWELRVALPGLSLSTWGRIGEALPGATLVPGPSPGQQVCDDLGHREVEELEGGGLVAVLHFDADHGGVLTPALRPDEGPRGVEDLEVELAAALGAVSSQLVYRCELGEGRVQPVVERSTGRLGVQLTLPDALLDSLPGTQLMRLRQDIVAALARVVERRARAGSVRLAPDLLWDTRLGMTLTLWLLAPHAPPLAGDCPVPPGLTQVDVGGLDELVESLEVQVVPASPADHDRVVAAVVDLARRTDASLVGGSPRWLRAGARWAFCPTWTAPVDDGAAELAAMLRALPGVEAVRVAPGEPAGLGEVWHQSEPSWHPGTRRWLLRAHDGLNDRDRLERVEDRGPTPRDLEVELAVARVAMAAQEGASLVARPALCRPVRDSRGREGVEILVDGEEAVVEAMLRPALDCLCSVDHPELCSLGSWGFRQDGVHVHLWFPCEGDRGRPPLWT